MGYVRMSDLRAPLADYQSERMTFGTYWWFVDQVNAAKASAQKGGNVDGAIQNVNKALAAWQGGPYGVPAGDYQSPPDFAANAKNYIETFRRGQSQLQSQYQAATYAQYQSAPGGGAVKEIDTGSGSVAKDFAKGTASDAYSVSAFLSPFGFITGPISLLTGGGKGAVGGKVSDITGGKPGETIGGRAQEAGSGVFGAAVDTPRRKVCEASCDESQIVWSEQAQACVDRVTGAIIADPSKDPRCTKSAIPWCLVVDPFGKNCLGPAARVGAFAAAGAAVGGGAGLVVGKSTTGAVIGLFSGAVLAGIAGYLSTKVV